MSVVTYDNGTIQRVKNLGWLLKHAAEVGMIEIRRLNSHNAYMTVYSTKYGTGTGWRYETHWGEFSLATEWINRPSLRHADQTIINTLPTLKRAG